jgi:hypothetical protein
MMIVIGCRSGPNLCQIGPESICGHRSITEDGGQQLANGELYVGDEHEIYDQAAEYTMLPRCVYMVWDMGYDGVN